MYSVLQKDVLINVRKSLAASFSHHTVGRAQSSRWPPHHLAVGYEWEAKLAPAEQQRRLKLTAVYQWHTSPEQEELDSLRKARDAAAPEPCQAETLDLAWKRWNLRTEAVLKWPLRI